MRQRLEPEHRRRNPAVNWETTMKTKILTVILLILSVMVSSVFAAEGETVTPAFSQYNIGGQITAGDKTVVNPFGPLITLFQQWLTSFLFGALCSIRFAKDILNAYVNRDEHPEAMKQAIIRFVVVIVFSTVIFSIIAKGVKAFLKAAML